MSDRAMSIVSDGDQQLFGDDVTRPALPEVADGSDALEAEPGPALGLDDGDHRAVTGAITLDDEGQPGKAEDACAKPSACAKSTGCATSSSGGGMTADRIACGWDLERTIKALFDPAGGTKMSPAAIEVIRQRLNAYLELGISRRGRLHSLMLRHAMALAKDRHLQLLPFVRRWNLDLFRPEDFEKSVNEDGRQETSLFELVLQQLGREAALGAPPGELDYVLPCLEDGLRRFPENDWFKLSMAKVFRGLGRLEDARSLARDIARNRAGEYWSWELVGDLAVDPVIRTACYAKALTCSTRDELVSKARVKFAGLIKDQHPGQAKSEIDHVIAYRRRVRHPALAETERLALSEWYRKAAALPSGPAFYDRFKGAAEEEVFPRLPWVDASLGDEFLLKGRDGRGDQLRRRVYMKARPLAIEVSMPATHPGIAQMAPGTAIRVQIESSASEPWKTAVHRIEPRPDGRPDDVFEERLGVVASVNHAKSTLYFIVAKDIEGMFPLAEFAGVAEPGQTVAVRMATRHSREGVRTRALSVVSVSGPPPASVARSFSGKIRVTNGMGFSVEGVFLPPSVVFATGIVDGDRVEGLAVISFDAKKSAWGWKAVRAAPLRAAPVRRH